MRADSELEQVMATHADTVWRVCTLMLPQAADAEDAFQNTFVKFATHEQVFNDDEHVKAWLIRVATNICKDALRARKRQARPTDPEINNALADIHPVPTSGTSDMSGEATATTAQPPPGAEATPVVPTRDEAPWDAFHEPSSPLEEKLDKALATLPDEQRHLLYLIYYEGYLVVEVAKILGKPVNTLYTQIARAKKQLKEVLEREEDT